MFQPSSSARRRNKPQSRAEDYMDMQEFDWVRNGDWTGYRGGWQTSSPDIASSTTATASARAEDVTLGGIAELKAQLFERLDEQWLMIRQLSQCVQETNRQLGMLTFFMQQHSIYDNIHGEEAMGCRQPKVAAQRPVRFNPDMCKRSEVDVCDARHKIALRMQPAINDVVEQEMPIEKPAARVVKKRSGLLSIKDIFNACEQQVAAPTEQPEKPINVSMPQGLTTAPPPPAPVLPPLPALPRLQKPVVDQDQNIAKSIAPGVSSHVDTYRAPTKERRVPAAPISASLKEVQRTESESESEIKPRAERANAVGSRRIVETPCPTCSACRAEPARSSATAETPAAPIVVQEPKRPAMSVMQMARMFDKQNRG
ncbi:hypothetical protein LPJ57_000299 [Coemansia sp. RSA 486]|nr:hypothetical protein LPJ57_000299 [Coemansia sp. RSA 486]